MVKRSMIMIGEMEKLPNLQLQRRPRKHEKMLRWCLFGENFGRKQENLLLYLSANGLNDLRTVQ